MKRWNRDRTRRNWPRRAAWSAAVTLATAAVLLLQPPTVGPDRALTIGPPRAEAASKLCTVGSIVDAVAKNLKAANFKPDEIASALLGTAETFKITGYNRYDVLGRAVFKFKDKAAFEVGLPTYLHPNLNGSIKDKVNGGITNLKLMQQGLAPVGPDGLS